MSAGVCPGVSELNVIYGKKFTKKERKEQNQRLGIFRTCRLNSSRERHIISMFFMNCRKKVWFWIPFVKGMFVTIHSFLSNKFVFIEYLSIFAIEVSAGTREETNCSYYLPPDFVVLLPPYVVLQ